VKRREFISAAAAALLQARRVRAQTTPGAGTLRRAVGSEITSLDPQRPTGVVTTEIAAELFEGLCGYDAAGRIVPGCAESWQASSDGLRWQFRLRSQLRWSDGAPLTASDFVLALRRYVTPAAGAGLASRLDAIRGAVAVRNGRLAAERLGVAAPDARTLTIELEHPEPQLPTLLAPVYCVPGHVVSRGEREWARPERIVSNGPYALEAWAPGAKTIVLRRNPGFRDQRGVAIGRVEWLTGYDAATRLRLFRLGEVDIATVEDATSLASARRELNDRLRSAPATAMGWIGLNLRQPPLGDRRVRQAMSLALDRPLLAGRVRGLDDRPSDALLPPGLADQPSPQRPPHAAWPMPQRLARARELMRESGFDGTPGRRVRLGIGFPVPNPAAQKFYLAVSAMWKAIGVDAELQPLEGRAYNAALLHGQFDVFSFNTFAQVPVAAQFLDRFLSGSSINYCGYASPEFDRLFVASQREATADGAKRSLAAAESIILRDTPVIPVYAAYAHRLVSARVRGWVDHGGLLRSSRHLSLA
jgi:oligopeptide transport system substrate-binding protein